MTIQAMVFRAGHQITAARRREIWIAKLRLAAPTPIALPTFELTRQSSGK
jgi:hypothetical protein